MQILTGSGLKAQTLSPNKQLHSAGNQFIDVFLAELWLSEGLKI